MKQETTERKRGGQCRAGFTLVEMLVVIVIILVLMGLVFKMSRPVIGKQAEAVTIRNLERLKAALEEYYAEYGQYPPVPHYPNIRKWLDPDLPDGAMIQPLCYEYNWDGGMRSDMVGKFGDENHEYKDGPLFSFGLMSFLVPRRGGTGGINGWPTIYDHPQWLDYNEGTEDSERDKRACARWAPFLEDIIYTDFGGRSIDGDAYTNYFKTVRDGWESPLVYVSPPPHQTYLLFSKGPDKACDLDAPDNRSRPANKDNIYGDVGFVKQ